MQAGKSEGTLRQPTYRRFNSKGLVSMNQTMECVVQQFYRLAEIRGIIAPQNKTNCSATVKCKNEVM